MSQLPDRIKYSILDPTGNITALVETETEISLQPEIAARIMKLHPEVEQVGFVRYADPIEDHGNVDGELRMAGGEFCGNASMSAAALCLLRRNEKLASDTEIQKQTPGAETQHQAPDAATHKHVSDIEMQVQTVVLTVSGTADPIAVRLQQQKDGAFAAVIEMPPVPGAEETEFTFAELKEKLPLVRMEGISHIIIGRNSGFFRLKHEPELAEQAVRKWCAELGTEGLGLMFLEDQDSDDPSQEKQYGRAGAASVCMYRMTPLVFVPGGSSGGSLFWENSCASGTAAARMYLASVSGRKTMVSLSEPGGILKAECDPETGKVQLHGGVSLVGEFFI